MNRQQMEIEVLRLREEYRKALVRVAQIAKRRGEAVPVNPHRDPVGHTIAAIVKDQEDTELAALLKGIDINNINPTSNRTEHDQPRVCAPARRYDPSSENAISAARDQSRDP